MDLLSLDLPNIRVLVIGDMILDRYLWGKVHRISPEAPVPVVKMLHTSMALGGGGNVANNLAGLGCRVSVIGLCGRDDKAALLRQIIHQQGIDDNLVEDTSRPTITKTRVMAHKQQVLRLDEEDDHSPAPEIILQIKKKVFQELDRCQAVILSDYGKGLLAAPGFCQELIQLAHQYKRPVFIDPKGTQWERYQSATCVTPNIAEFEAVAGQGTISNEKILIALATEIRKRYRLNWLLVTRGSHGMCLVGPKAKVVMISAQAREVYDVSGAGDTVIATLAAVVAAGAPFEQAAQMANTAAGIVVGKLGTQPILHSELSTAWRFNNGRQHFPYSAVKMAGLDSALAKVQEWRAAGDTIVFTNGCFDLLHPGHVSLLYQARALGNRLIVGLNTDASVRRLKGPQRPILSEQDRAAILGALACVDLVVYFEQDTPLKLIQALQPHILVKGSDYQPEEVVGKAEVEAYGGCVKLVDLIQGYSTTRIAEKVLSGAKINI